MSFGISLLLFSVNSMAFRIPYVLKLVRKKIEVQRFTIVEVGCPGVPINIHGLLARVGPYL